MPVMTVPVEPGPRALGGLVAPAGQAAVEAVRDSARPLARLRVVHLVSPPFAPRALDLLRSSVPLLRDAGLDVRWLAVAGDDRADGAARAVGDALRGGEPGPLEELTAWRERAAAAASEVPRGTDVVVVHGAEGLALLARAHDPPAGATARWVWWTEGDLSAPDPGTWSAVGELASGATAIVAERESWAPPHVAADVTTMAPAVDPLAARNLDLPPRVAGPLARSVGIDLGRPFVVAVCDLDGWSGPEDPIATLHAAQDAGAAGLQLALVARLGAGDPRAWRTLGELSDQTAGDGDVLVVADAGGAADAEVNALQRLARVALAEREDTSVAEALWKTTPAVTEDELGDAAQRGARVAELVADPGLALELGRAGRERVRADRLITRLLVDQLELYARITSGP